MASAATVTPCAGLNFTISSPTYVLNNQPGPNPTVELTLNITRTNNAPNLAAVCNGFISFDQGDWDSPAYTRRLRRNASNFVSYNYYSSSTISSGNILEACGTTNASKQIAFSIPINASSTSRTYFVSAVAPPGGQANGTYEDSFTVRSWQGNIGTCTQSGGTRTATVQFNVRQNLAISLSSTSISLGTLSTSGPVGTSDLSVTYSGGGFRLGIRSTNGSKLVKAGATGQWNYQASFRNGAFSAWGSYQNLPSVWTYIPELQFTGSGTNTRVISINVRAVAPAPTGPLAGTYTDVIHFEASAI